MSWGRKWNNGGITTAGIRGSPYAWEPFLYDHFISHPHTILQQMPTIPPPPTRTILQQEPYYKDTTTIHNNTAAIQNNTTTNMSVDEQRPAATFGEALRDVQPRPGLEATLMARHPELQVEAEWVRRARQEEEQADFSRGNTHARSGDGDVAILVLDVAMTTSRSAHFIKNSSKLDYFYILVGTSPANNLENPASSLWFLAVEYSNRIQEALSLFWFWMKQSQRQWAAILFKILVN
jgi:hypothetical protein